ncbi:PucR family transcriptional regulator [Microbacterium sediminicola]|uniref:PucR family transcriptional regulator n=1 Tax=Microbacterium sediminicola TaxID=415210 RepID=A0ABN2HRB1_9MICO
MGTLPASGPSLRTLLRLGDLNLRLVTPEEELLPGVLDTHIRWVHSSDLPDPTPFLSEDVALLTTGTQFFPPDGEWDVEHYRAYATRLAQQRVRGLGFGTEVVREGVPTDLIRACAETGIPLFEVPYRTPFLAVARANADASAEATYSRQSWALAAQRSLSLAALRTDGVKATVAELSRQVGSWVALFDAGGSIMEQAGPSPTAEVAASLEQAATELTGRAKSATSVTREPGANFTISTLGRAGALRGALAVATASLDYEARGVVGAAVATIGLALEQRDEGEEVLRGLRSGVSLALTEGHLEVARGIAHSAGIVIPDAPFTVGISSRPENPLALTRWMTSHDPGALWSITDDGILLAVKDPSLFDPLTKRFRVQIGTARADRDEEIPAAIRQARLARELGSGTVTTFEDVQEHGLMYGLRAESAEAIATAFLLPIAAHDAAHRTSLVETLRAWFLHDCANESTALALGIHRHTVRARISLAEKLLGRDLAQFSNRAEVWTALELSG